MSKKLTTKLPSASVGLAKKIQDLSLIYRLIQLWEEGIVIQTLTKEVVAHLVLVWVIAEGLLIQGEIDLLLVATEAAVIIAVAEIHAKIGNLALL